MRRWPSILRASGPSPFDYAADYPVEALALEAQVPLTAEGYALEPDTGASAQECERLDLLPGCGGFVGPG